MHCTKNCIVGKASRVGLPGRPSPITRTEEPRAYAYVPPRAPKHTLPTLASDKPDRVMRRWFTDERVAILRANWPTYKSVTLIMAEMAECPGPELPDRHTIGSYANNSLQIYRPADFRSKTTSGPRAPRYTNVAPRKVVPAAPRLVPQVYARVTGCCWPIGEPGTREFLFCDVPHKNKSYCDEHQQIAYVRLARRDKLDDFIVTPATRSAMLFGRLA